VQQIDLTEAGANSGTYEVRWKGNSVTGISPDAPVLPLFSGTELPPLPH
jgi:hypothetical protein